MGGDSAGGNFTAAICQRARRSGPAIAYQVLIQPGVDWANLEDYASWAEFGTGEFEGARGYFVEIDRITKYSAERKWLLKGELRIFRER